MAKYVKRIYVTTDAAGAFVASSRLYGSVEAIAIDLGTLSTPDITVSDDTFGITILDVAGVAADVRYQPAVAVQDDAGAPIVGAYAPPTVMGTLKVEVAGGGDTKTGTITLLVDR